MAVKYPRLCRKPEPVETDDVFSGCTAVPASRTAEDTDEMFSRTFAAKNT